MTWAVDASLKYRFTHTHIFIFIMMKITVFDKFLVVMLMGIFTLGAASAQSHQNVVLPKPRKVEFTNGYCQPLDQVTIRIKADKTPENASYLAEALVSRFGLVVGNKKKGNTLTIHLKNSGQKPGSEAYRLSVEPSGISISADDEKGVFYGSVTPFSAGTLGLLSRSNFGKINLFGNLPLVVPSIE